jgi:predicted dehydrogenase
MDGEKPSSVFSVTQQIKPDVYPKVEDEATVVLTYGSAQGIIQASWNWPFDRKDMEVYGQSGYVLVPRRDLIKGRVGNASETEKSATPLQRPQSDPLSYLAGLYAKKSNRPGFHPWEINMIVTEILDAARESARTGKRIYLK